MFVEIDIIKTIFEINAAKYSCELGLKGNTEIVNYFLGIQYINIFKLT